LSSADIKVEWGLIPAIDIDYEVLKAWRDVRSARGASIKLYKLRDQANDYYDYRLIE